MNRAFRRLGTLVLTITGSALVTGCATVEQDCPGTKVWNPQKQVTECRTTRYTAPAPAPVRTQTRVSATASAVAAY